MAEPPESRARGAGRPRRTCSDHRRLGRTRADATCFDGRPRTGPRLRRGRGSRSHGRDLRGGDDVDDATTAISTRSSRTPPTTTRWRGRRGPLLRPRSRTSRSRTKPCPRATPSPTSRAAEPELTAVDEPEDLDHHSPHPRAGGTSSLGVAQRSRGRGAPRTRGHARGTPARRSLISASSARSGQTVSPVPA